MSYASSRSATLTSCAAAALLFLGAACGEGPAVPTTERVEGPRLAKAAGTVTVTAANPDTGSQGTTLDVAISGSGFTSDMIATWKLAGVADSSQVRTNSTRFVSSTQVVANITIAPTATAASWDIQVASAGGGKGGIGTEMFAVKINGSTDLDPRVAIVFDDAVNVAAPDAPANWQPAGIVGDGRDEVGQPSPSSRYQGGFCGVEGKVLYGNGGTDLRFDPDFNYTSAMSDCGAKRGLRVYLGYQPGGARGTATLFGAGHNARSVGTLADGEVRSQPMGFGEIGVKGCERVQFNPELHPGAALGRVTRLPDEGGARRYRVESQYPHMAVCMVTQRGSLVPTSTLKYVPFAYTAVEVPFPYPTYP